MHLAKQGVCVPAEQIFSPCTSGLTERREQGWFWGQTWCGVWAEVPRLAQGNIFADCS